MNKQEIIKELQDKGHDTTGLKWHELLDLKRKGKIMLPEVDITHTLKLFDNPKMNKLKEDEDKPVDKLSISPTTQKDVDEHIIRKLSKREIDAAKLAETRKRLLPEIKAFIKKMKSRTEIRKEEITLMMKLYNEYYVRNDSGSCNSCVARVFNTLKKLK